MGIPSVEELAGWIGRADEKSVRALHARAYAVKEEVVGRRVSMRGLIEAGNVCAKDCRYCGIRASNRNLMRYQLTQKAMAMRKASVPNAAAKVADVVEQKALD